MFIAMVPLLTIAQSKKSKAKVEYMMIRGVEVRMNDKAMESGEDVREMALGRAASEDVKLIVVFDYGDVRHGEAKEMRTNSRRFRTMMSAVNYAAEKGWEFFNSDVVLDDKMKVHYYYMRRDK